MKDKIWVRQLPPKDLLFWKFVGRSNLVFTTGDEWKKHSRVVTSVFQRRAPIADFETVSEKLLEVIDRNRGDPVSWDTLAKRVTIDILGLTILGNDIEALDHPDSPLYSTYIRALEGLTAPPYIFLPFLDKYFPRKRLVKDVEYLRQFFSSMIDQKKGSPGSDLISFTLAEPTFTMQDVLDNVSLFFVAGHVSFRVSY